MRPLPITRRFRLPDQADLERQQAQAARAEEDDALNRAHNDIAAISKCWSVTFGINALAGSQNYSAQTASCMSTISLGPWAGVSSWTLSARACAWSWSPPGFAVWS